jgi:hypothetical protein
LHFVIPPQIEQKDENENWDDLAWFGKPPSDPTVIQMFILRCLISINTIIW